MNAPGLFSAGLAGLLSFLSPCVLPLVPAYLSFISGTTAAELSGGHSRGKIFVRSLAFSLGFTLAFTILGIIFSGGAMFVGQGGASRYVDIAGGILVIFLGFNLIFDFMKFLNADSRLIGRFTGQKGGGILSSTLLGLAFAAGWSPCIGPILASILLYAGRERNIPGAMILLLSYSPGFAIPFLLTGLFFDRLKPLLSFFSRHGKAVRGVSGIVLILFGAAMAMGSLGSLTSLAAKAGYGLESFIKNRPDFARFLAAGIWAIIAAAMALPLLLSGKKKFSSRRKIVVSGLAIAAALLAAAELAGIFSTFALVARWLTFSGI